MKKYTSPQYEKQELELNDVILTSLGATITEISKSEAKVSASVYSILGIR